MNFNFPLCGVYESLPYVTIKRESVDSALASMTFLHNIETAMPKVIQVILHTRDNMSVNWECFIVRSACRHADSIYTTC